MAIRTKYYYGSPGAWSIMDAELAHILVLQVTRSGTDYNVTTTGSPDPSTLLCSHDLGSGEISWGTSLPFPESADRPPLSALEKISVKFKY